MQRKERERERKNLKITVLTQKEATKGSAVHIQQCWNEAGIDTADLVVTANNTSAAAGEVFFSQCNPS